MKTVPPSSRFKDMEEYIFALQATICSVLEVYDNAKFSEEKWDHKEGGGGITRIINGGIFEKGGVNTSSISGLLPDVIASKIKTDKSGFRACGISIVIHPYSPKIPTIHMNVRYFETENGRCWFGGGIDLTPYYPYPEDFTFFHKVLKNACETVKQGTYAEYKKECDEYFTIKHRNEMRGIGGIFFDYIDGKNSTNFKLVKSVGDSFLDIYLPLIKKRKDEKFTAEDKKFQLIRRGRYVEFNLIYDRGTLFGLKTGGRIESILMSLPPSVSFLYDWRPVRGTPQFEMIKYYRPVKWA